jgi:PKD repeat protein
MKRLLLLAVLLLAIVGTASADTLIVYTTNATDTQLYKTVVNGTFSQVHDAATGSTSATVTYMLAGLVSSTAWENTLYRSAEIYDSSLLPDTCTINSATVGNYVASTAYTLGDDGATVVSYTYDGAFNTDDYHLSKFGTTIFAPYTNISTLSASAYTNWTLNSDGLAAISKTGNTAFGIRTRADIENTSAWVNFQNGTSNSSRITFRSADYVLYPPFLEIAYTPADTTPPQSITGLTNTSVSCSQVFFNWTNPTDADYGGLMVWRNNTALTNLTNATTGVSWDGLPGSTDITFSSKTFDLTGNVNATFVNMTRTTEACGVAPVAAFSANETEICIDDWVQFTDESTNTPTMWHWILTGGWDSHDQNPYHQFDAEGLYSVNLTASNDYGSDYEYKVDYINVTNCTPPEPTPTPTPAPEDWEACFPWCGIQELFFWNASSDVSGYKILDHYPELSEQREVNVTVSAATGSQQLGAWLSPAGTPGVTTIAPGFWRFRTFHNVSSQVGTTTLEFFIMNRSSDGTEINLFYNKVITEDINSLTPDEYLLSYARRNATTLFAGDRLLLKVNASTTSVTAREVYMWLAGNTNTSMVQASNFICCEDGSCSGGGSGIAGIEWPLVVYGLVGGILGALVIIRRGKP